MRIASISHQPHRTTAQEAVNRATPTEVLFMARFYIWWKQHFTTSIHTWIWNVDTVDILMSLSHVKRQFSATFPPTLQRGQDKPFEGNDQRTELSTADLYDSFDTDFEVLVFFLHEHPLSTAASAYSKPHYALISLVIVIVAKQHGLTIPNL